LAFVSSFEVAGDTLEQVLDFGLFLSFGQFLGKFVSAFATQGHDAAAVPENTNDAALGYLIVKYFVSHNL